MPFRHKPVTTLLSFFLCLTPVLAENEPLKPLRIEAPPVIDGRLDDEAWNGAPSVTGFKTFIPYFGRDVAEQTTVYMLYDAENLYFGFDCYDPEPGKIKTSLAERDKMRADDWICINLDTFNDHQTLYALYVNPAGIQGDSRFAAGQEDFSADIVWYSAGSLTEHGYSIEVRIPLKSIRYSDKNPTMMSVFFERYVSRNTEHSSFPHLDPAMGFAFLPQMMPMEYHNLEHYTLLEILPAVTYAQKYADQQGKLEPTEKRFFKLADASLTMKYGFTSDLILDATLNPDFSQIEADAGQVDVNLRFQLFYPEKRPFFLEGREIFNIAATGISELDPLSSVIHTRTIVDPTIGMKLSGKLGDNNTISALYSKDELPTGSTERFAHFPILRYKRSLSDDSFFGGIVAGRELEHGWNRVGGMDAQLRVGPASVIQMHGLVTRTRTSDTDPQGTGHALGIQYSYGTETLDYDFTFKEISDNFRLDMGYVTRTGIQGGTARVRPKLYPSSGMFRRIDLEGFTGQTKDKPSGIWETYNHASVTTYFRNALSLRARYVYSTEVFLNQLFNTSGIVASGGGLLTNWLSVNLTYQNRRAIAFSATPYQGRSTRVTASATLQPSEQVRADLSMTYFNFYRSSDGAKIFDYPISRARLISQLNKYLFFRGILEYNNYRKQLLADFLASFTYIPGTVVHLGYGSIFKKTRWENGGYVDDASFLELQRGLFFKMSYLWRL